MCCRKNVSLGERHSVSRGCRVASGCSHKGYGCLAAFGDDDSDELTTSWEDLMPELDTDDGEPFETLPEFGEPPSWADLDDWDNEED